MDRMSSLAMLHPPYTNPSQTAFLSGHVLQPVPLPSRPDCLLTPAQNTAGPRLVTIGSSHTAFSPYRSNNDRHTDKHPPATCGDASIVCSFNTAITEAQAGWLLFSSVRWVRALPSYHQLPTADQILLLRNSWLELYALTYLTTLKNGKTYSTVMLENYPRKYHLGLLVFRREGSDPSDRARSRGSSRLRVSYGQADRASSRPNRDIVAPCRCLVPTRYLCSFRTKKLKPPFL